MKIFVAIAFLAILGSLGSALFFMMRGGKDATQNDDINADTPAKSNHGRMAKALAFRVGFSILLFACILMAWKLGYIQPSGIPACA